MGSQSHIQSPFPLPFFNPHEQQQHPGVADKLKNKTGVCWDTVCMQQDKGKTTLAVSEESLASKKCTRQGSSLPQATLPGEVLERVV